MMNDVISEPQKHFLFLFYGLWFVDFILFSSPKCVVDFRRAETMSLSFAVLREWRHGSCGLCLSEFQVRKEHF